MKRFLCIFLHVSVIFGMDIVPFKPFETYYEQKESVLERCLPLELFVNIVFNVVLSDAKDFKESDVQSFANLSGACKKYANYFQRPYFIKAVVEYASLKYDIAHEKYCENLQKIPAFKKILALNELVHQCMFTKQSYTVILATINNPFFIPNYIYKSGCTHLSHARRYSNPFIGDLLLEKGSKSPISEVGSASEHCIAGYHYNFWLGHFIEISSDINWIDSCGFTLLTNQLLPCFFSSKKETVLTIKSFIDNNVDVGKEKVSPDLKIQITQGEYKGLNAFSLIKKLYCSSDQDPETQNFGKQLLQILNKL